jgi:phage terminase large subunit
LADRAADLYSTRSRSRLIEVEIKARRQFKPLLETDKRWGVVVAHRRAGKTVGCVQKAVKGALECRRPDPRFAYVAPLYRQAKDVAWNYLKRLTAQIGGEPNESELRVDLPGGARVRLYGADNPDSLRGIYLDGVVLDEYADMRPSVWGEIIRPMLSDRKGWAVFIGTPKGRNEFYEIWERAKADPAWYALILRASESGLLDEQELVDARRDMTPEQYAQEYECSFEAAILGAYFGKEIAEAERQGRIKDVAYEPELPVYTAWDLGIGDSTAIWFFQVVGDEIRVIDHYENHGQGLAHYVAELVTKPYRYAKDYVPHDARVKELGSGRTRIETLIGLGRKPELVPSHKVDDGINAARLTLARCFFDRTKCADGLEALRQYKADYDEKLRTFKDKPRHDWASHSADAFRYLAMAYREMQPGPPPPPKPKWWHEQTAAEIFALDKFEEPNKGWI